MASNQSNNTQRMINTGNNKHRAISVSEQQPPIMETTNQANIANHFNARHASQSSQEYNRKNYKVDFPGVQNIGPQIGNYTTYKPNQTHQQINTTKTIYGRKFK